MNVSLISFVCLSFSFVIILASAAAEAHKTIPPQLNETSFAACLSAAANDRLSFNGTQIVEKYNLGELDGLVLYLAGERLFPFFSFSSIHHLTQHKPSQFIAVIDFDC